MKNLILTFALCISGISLIYSQEPIAVEEPCIIDVSNNDLSYIFANIYWNRLKEKKLTNTSVRVIQQGDPLGTLEEYFEGSDEILIDLFISLTNTGEYAKSKLFKIPNLNGPEVLNIAENLNTGKITIKVKHRNKKGKILINDFKFEMLF